MLVGVNGRRVADAAQSFRNEPAELAELASVWRGRMIENRVVGNRHPTDPRSYNQGMAKTRKPSAKKERIGVLAVGQLVQSELDWIFREQVTDDYGIDAQIEIVDGETVTGKLIAAQIKSGSSYFKRTSGGWWFYLDPDDLEYWLDHSLPVIVVCYDPATSKAYWESVQSTKLISTKSGGSKLLIPDWKELGEESQAELAALAEGNQYDLRIRQLRLALPWMKLLVSGRRVLLEADEWIHKSSGRGDLAIVSVDEANEDREELGTWMVWGTNAPYENTLPSLVPWADVVLHEETYDDADYEAWQAECVRYDKEGDRFEIERYGDWHMQFHDILLRPYGNSSGEVDHWRLELVLNDLGRAFLLVDEFAEGTAPFLAPK